MDFASFMTDTVSLIKRNGQRVDGIKASVQRENIIIMRSDLLIESEDLIYRTMSNGGSETYVVIEPGFREKFGSIQAHYQMRVQRLGNVDVGKTDCPGADHLN